MLEVSNLHVKYENSTTWALENIFLNARDQEFIIVAGSSGSGKSTLAKAILGLVPIFENAEVIGEIKIVDRISPINRIELVKTIGYVPQYPADFVTSLLVEEEIVYPLENLGFTPEEMHKRLQFVLERLDIVHLRERLVTELSSGELQRVALATAIAPAPPILILDEPMARIDSRTEIVLARLLKELAQNGQLIIAFEHRLDYLLPLADRVIVLESGNIVAEGDPSSIIDQLVGVDLPEVSEVYSFDNRPIDLEEARQLLLDKLTSINNF
ncbi:MAG: energy-coupling factor ABC transporter ATP-binding protein [Candidatus Hodarchaeales archaeon]